MFLVAPVTQQWNWDYREEDDLVFKQGAVNELQLIMEDREGDALIRRDTPLGDLLWATVEEHLTDRERWVLDAYLFERKSVRSIGLDLSLSKSQVHRIKDQALAKLHARLLDAPMIRSYLGLPCNESESE